MSTFKIFIASSSEHLDIAYAIQENLANYNLIATVWNQNIFDATEVVIEALENTISKFDYAVFIFNPTDITNIRNNITNTIRDNVIFELGLFMGRIGRKNCFIISEKKINLTCQVTYLA